MFNFEEYLLENEEILWKGKPVPGKGGNSIGGLLFVVGFMLFIQLLMIWSVVTGTGDGAYGISLNFIIIFGVAIIIEGFCIYGIIYDLFIKKRVIADDEYCLTNKRVFKYDNSKDKLTVGFLSNFTYITSMNCKDGYGDVHFTQDSNKIKQPETVKEAVSYIMDEKDYNVKFLVFESIKSPRKIVKLAKQYKN